MALAPPGPATGAPRAGDPERTHEPSRAPPAWDDDPAMRTRLVIGAVLVIVGAVWIGQGVGAIGGSFMTGEAAWAVIGAVFVLLGLALISGARRSRREPPE